jgi:hypothetical protein
MALHLLDMDISRTFRMPWDAFQKLRVRVGWPMLGSCVCRYELEWQSPTLSVDVFSEEGDAEWVGGSVG